MGASTARTGKAHKGPAMEGWVARWYARNTARSMVEFRADARRVAAQLPGGGRVLEVAPGPGYLAVELAKLGDYRVVGLVTPGIPWTGSSVCTRPWLGSTVTRIGSGTPGPRSKSSWSIPLGSVSLLATVGWSTPVLAYT